jgi:hypothetical protein
VLVRFGLLWKVYDMVASKGLDWRLPILPSFPTSVYLLGGYAGNLFLVERVGLEQPAAHSGVVAAGHSPLKSVRYKTDGVRQMQMNSIPWVEGGKKQ